MRFINLLLATLPLIYAQDPSSPSPSASRSNSSNSSSSSTRSSNSSSSSATPTQNMTTFTTTLTTYPTTTTLSASFQPATTLALTFTLNAGDYSSVNESIWRGNYTNETIPFNGNEKDKPWVEGDGFIPFSIKIDPAFGVLGGLLILSGIPVAVLGGKNRWSSNAISSGYAMMLFTLVMVLRFGVEPNLQPPSPNPPSTTLRGLYLLACIISAFFGGAAGIFLYTFAKYWVSAIGGFTFGWFLLATRQGGLITSVLGRWGLLGGLAVGGLVASLPKQTNEWMMLVSTAWIGATAFTLGVDCYTRAGLKEFFVYNLGFHDLFPKLYGFKYPLTQTMMIELGILAAMVVIGAAIQFRVLNILTKRYRKMREEEEAKIEAEEIEKAAERFKNVGAELNEWEEKHGNASPTSGPGSSGPTDPYGSLNGEAMRATRDSVLLPQLGFESDRDRRPSSTLSLLRDTEKDTGNYEPLGMKSPTIGLETPQSMLVGLQELKSSSPEPATPTADNPELEQQMKLLAEVKKAREDIRGSLNRLKSSTPTPSIMSNDLLGRTTPTPTLGTNGDKRERHLSNTSSRLLDFSSDFRSASAAGENDRRDRHLSTTSSRILDFADFKSSNRSDHTHSTPPAPAPPPPQSEWEKYLAERKVLSPTSSDSHHQEQQNQQRNYPNRSSAYSSVPLNMGMYDRRERTTSMLEPRVSDFGPSDPSRCKNNGTYPADKMQRTRSEGLDRPSTYHDYLAGPSTGNNNGGNRLGTPIIIGSAADHRGHSGNRHSQHMSGGQRAMTYDELAERHRKRLSRLQDPVTAKMKGEIEIEEARMRWERQKKAEKEEMKRKERERFYRESAAAEPGVGGGKGKGREEGIKQAQEWRKSVVLSPPATAGATAGPSRDRERDGKKRASRQFAS
ncbi:hypothetical protein I302_106680 [Kwoniella bestiolae CBS 10118]|uniref:TM7S3/TM198-like domain-containing protein n=1 Tax=Kwoniella bestiolae CBS 10118 TaxID=1296100 RepID=A0A1B9G0Q0_9TREE|nr:hypothetical protein I302_06058 [Kwoniella bestiolae CBS 10118]OCF24597.1 hypothetical protein I302_06058 [Kwoniella bestiolae CBS 10118]